MSWFKKKTFHVHEWKVKKAVFPLEREIGSIESSNLTARKEAWHLIVTNSRVPDTLILTHYVICEKDKTVTLYCNQCLTCKKVVSCNAFDAQEAEKEIEIYDAALTELNQEFLTTENSIYNLTQ